MSNTTVKSQCLLARKYWFHSWNRKHRNKSIWRRKNEGLGFRLIFEELSGHLFGGKRKVHGNVKLKPKKEFRTEGKMWILDPLHIVLESGMGLKAWHRMQEKRKVRIEPWRQDKHCRKKGSQGKTREIQSHEVQRENNFQMPVVPNAAERCK